MWKYKGFFMLDLVLTLSGIILLSITIIPISIQFMIESTNEKEKYTATELLYEQLHEILIEGNIPTNQLITKSGKQYEFISAPVDKEVCIQYEIYNHTKEKVCEFLE